MDELNLAGAGDRLPPQNIETEINVIGAILFDPSAISIVVAKEFPAEAMSLEAHQIILRSALRLHSAGKGTDVLTMLEFLSQSKLLDKIGGQIKLIQCIDSTVSAFNIDLWLDLLKQKFLRRKLIEVGHKISQLGYKELHEDIEKGIAKQEELINEAEVLLFQLREHLKTENKQSTVSLADANMAMVQQIQEIQNSDVLPSFKTNFYDLDDLLGGGFRRKTLSVIAGRPSMGKSALGCAIAYRIAQNSGLPVVIYSLEMTKEEIAARYNVSTDRSVTDKLTISPILEGALSESQWGTLSDSINTTSQVPVFINDSSRISIVEIEQQIREIKKHYGDIAAVMVDYIHLMFDRDDPALMHKIGQATRAFKCMAKDYDLAFIALSQLNRNVEGRQNKRPILSDLRQSGYIEEDADVVLAIHRPSFYEDQQESQPNPFEREDTELITLKGRNCGKGMIVLDYIPGHFHFRNQAKRGF